jgi:hypothetical protein
MLPMAYRLYALTAALLQQRQTGTVNGAEFSKAFFKLGFAERTRRRKALLEHDRLKAEQAQVTVRHM